MDVWAGGWSLTSLKRQKARLIENGWKRGEKARRWKKGVGAFVMDAKRAPLGGGGFEKRE